MHCEQARQLFDAFLDGELSPSLAIELGAHRLACGECRRALALLEVSGHILRSDREPGETSAGFADRLMACVDVPRPWRRLRFAVYAGGPLAAAAVIALAFLGVFDRRQESKVAGIQQIVAPPFRQETFPSSDSGIGAGREAARTDSKISTEQALDEIVERTHVRMRETGTSLQQALDLTILQMLNILEEAKERSNRSGPDASNPSTGRPISGVSPGGRHGLIESNSSEQTIPDDRGGAAESHTP